MNRFRITQKRLLLVALLMASLVGRAAEAVRMQNYDQWKNLPSMVLFDKAKSYLQVGKIDSALVCFVIVSNRYDPKQSEPEKKIISAAAVGAGNIYTHTIIMTIRLHFAFI